MGPRVWRDRTRSRRKRQRCTSPICERHRGDRPGAARVTEGHPGARVFVGFPGLPMLPSFAGIGQCSMAAVARIGACSLVGRHSPTPLADITHSLRPLEKWRCPAPVRTATRTPDSGNICCLRRSVVRDVGTAIPRGELPRTAPGRSTPTDGITPKEMSSSIPSVASIEDAVLVFTPTMPRPRGRHHSESSQARLGRKGHRGRRPHVTRGRRPDISRVRQTLVGTIFSVRLRGGFADTTSPVGLDLLTGSTVCPGGRAWSGNRN